MRQLIFRERAMQTGQHMQELSKLLKWFLYQSSGTERHRLRKQLREWEQFAALVRATTSEAEFAALVRDGVLRNPRKGSLPEPAPAQVARQLSLLGPAKRLLLSEIS